MNIFVPYSTPNQDLSATKQAPRELGGSQVFLQKQGSGFEAIGSILTRLEFTQKRGVTRLSHPSLGKPQIQSCPGISPKERDRYCVVLGDEILGERLNIDEALKLAKGGERIAKTSQNQISTRKNTLS